LSTILYSFDNMGTMSVVLGMQLSFVNLSKDFSLKIYRLLAFIDRCLHMSLKKFVKCFVDAILPITSTAIDN